VCVSLTMKSVFYQRKGQYVPIKMLPSSGHGTRTLDFFTLITFT